MRIQGTLLAHSILRRKVLAATACLMARVGTPESLLLWTKERSGLFCCRVPSVIGTQERESQQPLTISATICNPSDIFGKNGSLGTHRTAASES